MNTKDISQAKNPDLRTAMVALKRAAKLARKTAIQTGTGIVIVENGVLVKTSAEELSKQERKEEN